MSGALGLLLGSAASSQVVLIGSADHSNVGSTNTIDKPTGTLAGDLLIGIAGSTGSVTWTGDSGWTEIADYGTAPGLRIARKTAGGAEAADYTFTASGSTTQSGIIRALRNAAFDVAGAFDHQTSGADLVMPSVTMTADGILVAICVGDSSSRTFSVPAGMVDVSPHGTLSPSIAIFAQSVGAGATGSRTSSPSGGKSTGILIGIKGA